MYTLIYPHMLYATAMPTLREAWKWVQVQSLSDAPTHIVQTNEDGDARVMDLSEFVRHARDSGY